MSEYQVIARKYRPQSFNEVIGQEAIVTTLRNAIKHNRLAHAYLFCGPRGTGKTTLARAFAKALNCTNSGENHEPCNACSFCKEIAAGISLDVLEIDGASHRGIDDIRQINDTVAYSASGGKYKIYIIDEVHMLTKEAFNALLKTLEEPPPKVIFCFATTEPHKVLHTILSRCQRFNLNRIPTEKIIEKLKMITDDLNVTIEEAALHLLAHRADGGMRDAESLLDQVLSFHEGAITASSVADILGVMSSDNYFEIDRAGKEGNLAFAFEVAHQIFSQGKDIFHFVEGLAEHFRNLLQVKLCGKDAPFLMLTESERANYEASAQLYRQDQCLDILDYLVEAQSSFRTMPSGRVALETILMHILRTHQRLPIEYLVKKLNEMQQNLNQAPAAPPTPPTPQAAKPAPAPAPKTPPPELSNAPTSPPTSLKPLTKEEQGKYDTLFQFAAVELEGQLKKN